MLGLPMTLIATLAAAAALPQAQPHSVYFQVIEPIRACPERGRSIGLASYFDSWMSALQDEPALAPLRRNRVDHDSCIKAAERFDAQLALRAPDIASVERSISDFMQGNAACAAKIEPSLRRIVFTSYPYGINGKVFADAVVINLYATSGDSPREFRRLILHEWIHGFKTQRIDQPDQISSLLFWEGEAVYGAASLGDGAWKDAEAAADLGFTPERLAQALGRLCRLPWTAPSLNGRLRELFAGNNAAFGHPRLGYFLGAKIFARLAEDKPWCAIGYEDFSVRYQSLLNSLHEQYCRDHLGRPHAQTVGI